MLKKWGPGLIALAFTALLISYPNEIKEGVKEAISTCTDNIIPSLFLFSLLSSFIVNSGAFLPLRPVFKRFMRLFMLSQNCAPALILGSFSGFPIGAKTAVQLYKNKLISKAEAENLLSFCNNCSPVFLIYVSISLWGNKEFGIYLYLIQLVSALVSGLMICRIFKAEQNSGYGYFKKSFGILDSLVISVKDALRGVGTVCGFVIFMSVIPVILRILNLSNSRFFGLITGFFEITAGLFSFKVLNPFYFGCCCFICSFGSVSVFLQAAYFAKNAGLSMKRYLLGKAVSGAISFFAGYFLFPADIEVFNSVLQQSSLGPSLFISLIFIFTAEFLRGKLRKLQKNKQGRYYADRQP